MRAIDTNVLVRLIVRDDLAQAAAADSFVRPGAWVSTLVLAETMWVLESVYEVAPTGLATAVAMLLNHEDLTVQDAEGVTKALELFQAKPGLGFSDCLILRLAMKNGHKPLGTFDRKLAKVDGAQKL